MSEPNYYNQNGLSPLEAFKMGLLSDEEFIGFCKGNIIKYVIRAEYKDDVVGDLDKAIDYIEWLREFYIEKKIGEDTGCSYDILYQFNDNEFEDKEEFESILDKLELWNKDEL